MNSFILYIWIALLTVFICFLITIEPFQSHPLAVYTSTQLSYKPNCLYVAPIGCKI